MAIHCVIEPVFRQGDGDPWSYHRKDSSQWKSSLERIWQQKAKSYLIKLGYHRDGEVPWSYHRMDSSQLKFILVHILLLKANHYQVEPEFHLNDVDP